MAAAPLLVVEDLRTHFFTRRGVTKAVDGVSFTLGAGETLAIVVVIASAGVTRLERWLLRWKR